MTSPRLHYRYRPISTFLIKIVATPLTLLVVGILILIFWGAHFHEKIIGDFAILLAILDLVSNAYQEVSADTRHAEVLKRLQALSDKIPNG